MKVNDDAQGPLHSTSEYRQGWKLFRVSGYLSPLAAIRLHSCNPASLQSVPAWGYFLELIIQNGVLFFQVQNFAFMLVKLHEFAVKKFLHLTRGPLNGSPGSDEDINQRQAQY